MLTLEQQATNYATMRHIERVRNLLNVAIIELLKRGELHDQCKMESPEVEAFTEKTAALAATTYGSLEYEMNKKDIDAALQHHYAHSRHHPEHFRSGMQDMNLIDLLEMFIDWKAASERHHDGNIRKSIEHNAIRFNMNAVSLTRIFENTIPIFD